MAEKLGKLMADLELEAIREHPIDTLHDAVARAEALVRVLAAQVAKLDGETAGDWTNPAALYGPDHKGDARPHILVQMYTAALERSGKLAAAAVQLGLDERRVILQEAQQNLMWAALRAAVLEVMFRFERLLAPDRRAEFRAFIGATEGDGYEGLGGLAEVIVRHLARLEGDPQAFTAEAGGGPLSLAQAPQALAMPHEERAAFEAETPRAADEW